MIDFVKIVAEEFNGNSLKEEPLLDFYGVVSRRTGEVKDSFTARYNDLVFLVLKEGGTFIKGSLHKYFNNGLHNHNDFTFSNLIATLNHLQRVFGIDIKKCKLQNLEVGLNFDPGMNTHDLLDNLVLHKSEKFKDVSISCGNYKQVQHTEYFLKAYDKALQNNMTDRIFRWEIKMKRANIINKYGIISLEHLLDKRLLKRLLDDLISKWEEALLLDPTIRYNELSMIDNLKMQSWRNTDHWIRLRKQYSKSRRYKFTKELKEYKYIVENHSENIQNRITNILTDKCNYCLNN